MKLTHEQRADIYRTFEPNERYEELLVRIKEDAKALDSLNTRERISLGLYQRAKAVYDEECRRRK